MTEWEPFGLEPVPSPIRTWIGAAVLWAAFWTLALLAPRERQRPLSDAEACCTDLNEENLHKGYK